MEKTDAGETHGNAIFVCCFNDIVVADGTARLGNIADTAFAGAFHIVAKGEESIGTDGDTRERGEPCLFLFPRQRLGLGGKEKLPGAIRENADP